jgi:hypothetical protein
MSEFKERVEEFKQSFQEPGFKTIVEDFANSEGKDAAREVDANVDNSQDADQNDAPAKRKHSRRTESYRNKIDQLTYERNVREAQNRDLVAKLQYQEELLADRQRQLEQKEQHNSAYYENNLHTRGNAVLNELKIAKEEGDIEKEVALSRDLAEIEAAKSTYNLYKSQQRQQPSENSYAPHYDAQEYNNYASPYQESSYNEPENEALEEWLEKNQWADQNSPSYSPRLSKEVTDLAAELDDVLRYNGSANIIGTPQYYQTLDNLMNERYAVSQPNRQSESYQTSENYPPREERQMNSGRHTVAPVTRRGSSMSDQYVNRNPNSTRQSIPLTQEEYTFARNLKIKMPDGSYRSGSPEALNRFYDAMKDDNGSGKITIPY